MEYPGYTFIQHLLILIRKRRYILMILIQNFIRKKSFFQKILSLYPRYRDDLTPVELIKNLKKDSQSKIG